MGTPALKREDFPYYTYDVRLNLISLKSSKNYKNEEGAQKKRLKN
jgi:hypothetical protein